VLGVVRGEDGVGMVKTICVEEGDCELGNGFSGSKVGWYVFGVGLVQDEEGLTDYADRSGEHGLERLL